MVQIQRLIQPVKLNWEFVSDQGLMRLTVLLGLSPI